LTPNTTSVVAGVVVTLLAAIPLTWLVTSGGNEAIPFAETPPTITATTAPPPGEVVITAPPPEIDGLTESVTRVLVVNGFAVEEGVEGVPDSVVRVLSARGIALTIAGDG
jgi:hypothetical protein